ncbi:MAG TPA: DUF6036 family nucleotidyltransferase [Terriglobales bacterium]|nr:DUF6036 family nucleotidyltransferase [Terriglobales bacterium]
MPTDHLPEPWKSFLAELDKAGSGEVFLHCIGGFVITQMYGLSRPTIDIDAITITPSDQRAVLLEQGGKGGPLHRKYGLYLDFVTVTALPQDYGERLRVCPQHFSHLRLFAVDAYDLALSKLERNSEKDREDVKHLARTLPFDLDFLRQRYEKELRFFLGNPQREDLTLKLWIETIEEERGA